jgi:hypothetical protein
MSPILLASPPPRRPATRIDEREHLRRISSLEGSGLHARGRTSDSETLADSLHEVVWTDRLSEHTRDVEVREITWRRRDDDDRNSSRLGGDFLLDGESIKPGKPQVKHDQIVSSRIEHSKSLETRARFVDPIASKAKRKPEQSAVIVVVFYNQDARRRHRAQLIPIRGGRKLAAVGIGYPRADLARRWPQSSPPSLACPLKSVC